MHPAADDTDNRDGEPVKHQVTEQRYELGAPPLLAVADYQRVNGRMILTHTFVPPELRGRGIAERLVRRALDDARAQNLKVVPACSYVAAFIKRHSEYHSLLAGER